MSRVESIFKRYSAALKGYISKQISSDSESEDMLHDIFYRFIVSDGQEESINNVASWLYRVARNMIIDRSRKMKEESMPYLHSSDENENDISLAEILLVDDNSPETTMEQVIISEELNLALAELPAEQRNVFELNELQGVAFKDISEATGVPINTLISQKRYAILYLRKHLAHLYDGLIHK